LIYNTVYQSLRDLETKRLVVRLIGAKEEGAAGRIPDAWVLADEEDIEAFEEKAREQKTIARTRTVTAGGEIPASRWEKLFVQRTLHYCRDVFELIRRSRGVSRQEIEFAFDRVPIGYTRSIGQLLAILRHAGWVEFNETRSKWEVAVSFDEDRQTLYNSVVEHRKEQRRSWGEEISLGSEIE